TIRLRPRTQPRRHPRIREYQNRLDLQRSATMNPSTSALTQDRAPILPPRGFLGLLLVALFWPANWMLPGLRTAYLFFPLWLGYILVVDALVQRRTGRSLWLQSRRNFVLLFALSIPAWWVFELFNKRL